MFKAGFLVALGAICAYIMVTAVIEAIIDILDWIIKKPCKK